jgi:1,4-dihydroxy-2-naphthoyl-CoA hydrolase
MAATLDAVLGIDVHELDAEHVVASFEVRDEHRQRFGLVHGGTYAAVAEFLASEGTVHGVAPDGFGAVGASNVTNFLRPVTEGTVRITGRARHRGRRSWVWEIDFHAPNGRLCATTRVTMAVIDPPGEPPVALQAPVSLR